MPRLLRASQLVLIIGSVLCAGAALGPAWLVRVGIVLAIITGILAVVLAFRHIRNLRREHAARVLKMTKDHGAAMTGERRRNAEVVEVLTQRANSASEQAKRQRVRIGELNAKVTELTGDNAYLRSELKSRDLTISGLRETVRSRDTEIQMLRADLDLEALPGVVGDVHGLPRHLRDQAGEDRGTEIWDDADHPTVVDMRAVEAAMPNLEVEQRRKRA
jgi:hypothetical protein